jgi:hypothetical protein
MPTLHWWLVVERIVRPSKKVDSGRSILSRWNPLTTQPSLTANAEALQYVGDVETVHIVEPTIAATRETPIIE